ncbi:hypothetical protein OG444_03030 [Streptomyces sp. NBC_01232]|uniref:hypothetical protein n=1 Tax=unclassified Streptomyces TaxID=2593676 RepID=UPI002E161FB2|nr:hypothetical protein OG444_03030 [Streptomyces sp. NBC_01232]
MSEGLVLKVQQLEQIWADVESKLDQRRRDEVGDYIAKAKQALKDGNEPAGYSAADRGLTVLKTARV